METGFRSMEGNHSRRVNIKKMQVRCMEYPLMEIPFAVVSFRDMKKNQAEQYFIWYMHEKEKRIKQLEQYVNQDLLCVILDKSPESLISLWEWFENKIEWKKSSEEELREELIGKTERVRNNLLKKTKRLSALTRALAEDIAIYFSDTLIYNNPEIHWGYRMKPKKLNGVNQPILMGFKGNICVNPKELIDLCILRSSGKRNREELFDTYAILLKNI